MNGKWYGVYDMKRENRCVGTFESTAEICAYFGGITKNRVWHAIHRKSPLAFKSDRFWIEVFKEPTLGEVRRTLRKKHGHRLVKTHESGIFVRNSTKEKWQLYAHTFEEAVKMLNLGGDNRKRAVA